MKFYLLIFLMGLFFSLEAYAQPARPDVQMQIQEYPVVQEGNMYHDYPIERRQGSYTQPDVRPGQQKFPPPSNMNNSSSDSKNTLKMEQTLSIIKPDAVQANHIGDIIATFEANGLRIAGIKMLMLTRNQTENFYHMHRGRPFYPGLINFMTSGPVVVLILEGENAVAKNRRLMGATDPTKAAPGTIRSSYATDIGRNAVHGSDSPEAAAQEISFFFQPDEIFRRF